MNCELIPLYAIEARMLVILEVAQDARLHSNVEIIGLVRPYWHKTSTHHEAVHLTADRAVHVGNLVSIEVIASRDIDVPVLCGANVSCEAEVMGELAFILHLLIIKCAISII